jgi:hypothetical protein
MSLCEPVHVIQSIYDNHQPTDLVDERAAVNRLERLADGQALLQTTICQNLTMIYLSLIIAQNGKRWRV